MLQGRSLLRNVHFFDGSTGDRLGGLCQNGSVTQASFLSMLSNILVIAPGPITVKARVSGQTITPTNDPLAHGDYDLYASSSGKYHNNWIEKEKILG